MNNAISALNPAVSSTLASWLQMTPTDRSVLRSAILELVEAGASAGQGEALRVFLASAVLERVSTSIGGPVEADLLVGMTTILKVAPQWSSRYHLGARVLDLGRDTTQSLARKRLGQLRQALRREGLYDRQRRLPAPRDITRLAIVHPAGAAGYADIAATLARWERVGLLVVRSHAVPFEGASAPQAIATALRTAVEPLAGSRPDLVLMVRGGGGRAGLAVLDHETIVRAVALCPVPIACGLGHAIDNDLLIGELAWRNLDTPSKALACVTELMRAPARQVRDALVAITSLAGQRLQAEEIRLQAYRSGLMAQGGRCLTGAEGDVERVFADIRIAIHAAGARCRQAVSDLQHLMRTMSAAVPVRIDAAERTNRDLRVQVSSAIPGAHEHDRAGRPGMAQHRPGRRFAVAAASRRPAIPPRCDRHRCNHEPRSIHRGTYGSRGHRRGRKPRDGSGARLRPDAWTGWARHPHSRAAHDAQVITLQLHDGDVAAVVGV